MRARVGFCAFDFLLKDNEAGTTRQVLMMRKLDTATIDDADALHDVFFGLRMGA